MSPTKTAAKPATKAGPTLRPAPPEPVADRDLEDLHPFVLPRAQAVLDELRGGGFDPLPTEVLRTNERQAWLHALGRTTVAPDGRGRGGAVVTRARTAATTWHGYRLAFDIVDRRILYNLRHPRWGQWTAALAAAARTHGFRWGADWDNDGSTADESFLDWPHLQLLAGPTGLVIPRSPSATDQADHARGALHRVFARYGLAAA